MKVKEIRELTDTAIKESIESGKKELFNLRLRKAAYDLENTAQLKLVRRKIARLNTVLRERELEKGGENGES